MVFLLAFALAAEQSPAKPTWPEAPIFSEMALGARAAKIKKGVDRVQGKDRIVIGKWADGVRSREVEEVVLLTPSLLSRWLGWLAFHQAWSAADVSKKWQVLRARFGEKPLMVVRLALYERNDAFELAEISRPRPSDLEDVGFQWIAPGASLDPKSRPLFPPDNAAKADGPSVTLDFSCVLDRWGRDPSNLNSIPWWASTTDWSDLWPTGYQPPQWDGLQRGLNRLKVFVVQAPPTQDNMFTNGGTLIIKKADKTLIATIPRASDRDYKVPPGPLVH